MVPHQAPWRKAEVHYHLIFTTTLFPRELFNYRYRNGDSQRQWELAQDHASIPRRSWDSPKHFISSGSALNLTSILKLCCKQILIMPRFNTGSLLPHGGVAPHEGPCTLSWGHAATRAGARRTTEDPCSSQIDSGTGKFLPSFLEQSLKPRPAEERSTKYKPPSSLGGFQSPREHCNTYFEVRKTFLHHLCPCPHP